MNSYFKDFETRNFVTFSFNVSCNIEENKVGNACANQYFTQLCKFFYILKYFTQKTRTKMNSFQDRKKLSIIEYIVECKSKFERILRKSRKEYR